MHNRVDDYLGAHPAVVDGVEGTRFAVWAPNAREVCVLCDRNGWQFGRNHLQSSNEGVWHGFVPGVRPGAAYKYGVRNVWGHVTQKSDPVAFQWELRPKSATIVADLSGYEWHDAEWLAARRAFDWQRAPISIYEMHLGSWKRPHDGREFFNYREIAKMVVEYVRDLGYTHLQLLPVTEHPFDGSWGYQSIGYFAPTSRFGTPHDFMFFVDHCHQNGIGVLIDWVPAHFPKDGHGLARYDGTALYEHEDPRLGHHPDWGTLVFNYGRFEVRNFLLSSARFWLEKYHVDGLRVDAVASMLYLDYSRKPGEWVPNAFGGRENLEAVQFLKDLNTQVHAEFPGAMTIAEESTAWGGVSRPVYTGGLGFTMKWDMGWMNDTLRYMHRDPVHRCHHQNELSFRMVYAFTENFVLPLSHDEIVHGKRSLLSQMPGDHWQKFANLRLLYGYQYAMPGKKLLFMGGEFGQWHEWQHDGQIDWPLLDFPTHAGLRRFVRDLNTVMREQPALHEVDFTHEGFSWISGDDWQNSVYLFVRAARDPADFVVCAFNFTPVPRMGYRFGVPMAGFYQEILNSDAALYGGSNVGNLGGIYSQPQPMHGREHSVVANLPPLAMVMFKPIPGKKKPAAGRTPPR